MLNSEKIFLKRGLGVNKFRIGCADGTQKEEDEKESEQFFSNPLYVHYVGLLQRPGVVDCAQMLEFHYYPVGTFANSFLHVRSIEWEGCLWVVISIPQGDRKKMERVTQVNRLRIANGIPCIISSKGLSRLPVPTDHVFTLENISGHPVYKQNV